MLAVLLLTFGTGFFVAGEFALVAADRPKIEKLAQGGDRRARSAMAALRNLSFQLSGAQLGITITSLIVGFIAEPTIGAALEPLLEEIGIPASSSLAVAVTAALIFSTVVQMVLGELAPKNLALARPVGLALALGTPVRAWGAAMKPLIHLFNNSANLTVRLLGFEPRDELESVRSLEELEILIQSSRAGGSLRAEEFSLLSRSISFGGKDAGDALTPRTSIEALPRESSLGDLVARSLATGFSRFPVTGRDIDDIVGIAHIKDVYRIPQAERANTPVTEITQDALIVPESRKLESLLFEMRSERRQMSMVIDEYGGIAGIITLEDLLEEIVGEIEDEYDPEGAGEPHLTASPEGVHVLSGRLHPDEVFEASGFEVPAGDYETLAGFLLSLFDRIPEQGAHTSYGGWEFKVVEMDRRRIAQVLAVAPSRPPEAEQDR